MPLGIVMRRTPGVTRWVAQHWTASAVLPGAGPADWRELRRDGAAVEYHAATVTLDLHGADTEAYLHGLQAQTPCIYVVLRDTGRAGDCPLDVVLATASPFEAQDYTDSGEEIVEKVPMPPALHAWVADFVDAFHVEETFVKRRRDRARTDLTEDGIGDARISQVADVYASPARQKRQKARLQ
ncbi:MAG: DUF3305 domain-containing protein [Marinibacterium sp.]|nr:DUF3305 domain-containing protein [Marinibacterium sp.]